MLWSCWKNTKPKNFNKIARVSIGGTRKKGRPCKRWRYEDEEDLHKTEEGKNGQALVRDLGNRWRLHWKAMTTMDRSAWWYDDDDDDDNNNNNNMMMMMKENKNKNMKSTMCPALWRTSGHFRSPLSERRHAWQCVIRNTTCWPS